MSENTQEKKAYKEKLQGMGSQSEKHKNSSIESRKKTRQEAVDQAIRESRAFAEAVSKRMREMYPEEYKN